MWTLWNFNSIVCVPLLCSSEPEFLDNQFSPAISFQIKISPQRRELNNKRKSLIYCQLPVSHIICVLKNILEWQFDLLWSIVGIGFHPLVSDVVNCIYLKIIVLKLMILKQLKLFYYALSTTYFSKTIQKNIWTGKFLL
jgi:hypothetical protein